MPPEPSVTVAPMWKWAAVAGARSLTTAQRRPFQWPTASVVPFWLFLTAPPTHTFWSLIAAAGSGMQFRWRDDERGREERGELFGGAEHRRHAFGVLGEVCGVLVRGQLVVGPPGGAF
jgi:hypothetical protein